MRGRESEWERPKPGGQCKDSITMSYLLKTAWTTLFIFQFRKDSHTHTTHRSIERHPYCRHFTPMKHRRLCMPPTPFLPTTASWDKATKMGCQHTFTTHAQSHFTDTESARWAHVMTTFTTTSRDCYRLQVKKCLTGAKAKLTCTGTTLPNVQTRKSSLFIVEGLAHSSGSHCPN